MDADNGLNGIVRSAADGKHGIPRAQYAKKRHAECVGAAGEVMAHKRRFRTKGIGKGFIKRIPADIPIAVAGRADQMLLADFLIDKGF